MSFGATIAARLKPHSEKTAVLLGRQKQFPWRKDWLTDAQLNHHVHIVGASGFGKTVLISHIIKNRIQNGRGLLFIDLKGDRDTIDSLARIVEDCGRRSDLKVFSLGDHVSSASYNLLGNGKATELRDRIMQSFVWSEEYYKNQSSSFLLRLLTGLVWLRENRGVKLDIALVLKCASKVTELENLLLQIPEATGLSRLLMEDARNFLKTSDNFSSLQGLRTQLESIVYSDFGDRVLETENGLELFKTVSEGKIAFVFLDTRRFGETAKAVGRFIIQDLKAVSARVDAEVAKANRQPFTVVIDEFADLAQEDFIAFLDRARSSRIGIVLAHQEVSDLDRVSPQFCGRLMGNTATLFAFLQKRPESAELISGIAGTRKVWKTTRATERMLGIEIDTGKRSKREVEEFNVHPNEVKSLGVGSCIRVSKYPRSNARSVKVRMV